MSQNANSEKWLDFLVTLNRSAAAPWECTGSGVTPCWMRAQIAWNSASGATVRDGMSWYAWIEGDPVRLVGGTGE